MTALMRQILDAVEKHGATRAHVKYLPEIAALVSQRKLELVRADQSIIEVRPAKGAQAQ
jgi:hypothetical protein